MGTVHVNNRLPATIGLCRAPSHMDEFCVHDAEVGEKCPSCDLELVIYVRDDPKPSVKALGTGTAITDPRTAYLTGYAEGLARDLP